jgi:hypothetical protein
MAIRGAGHRRSLVSMCVRRLERCFVLIACCEGGTQFDPTLIPAPFYGRSLPGLFDDCEGDHLRRLLMQEL